MSLVIEQRPQKHRLLNRERLLPRNSCLIEHHSTAQTLTLSQEGHDQQNETAQSWLNRKAANVTALARKQIQHENAGKVEQGGKKRVDVTIALQLRCVEVEAEMAKRARSPADEQWVCVDGCGFWMAAESLPFYWVVCTRDIIEVNADLALYAIAD